MVAMKATTPTLKAVPPIEAADITAARLLADAISAFNAGSEKRCAIGPDDLESVGRVRSAAHSLNAASRSDQDNRPAVVEIVNDTRRFCGLSTGSQNIEVSGERVDVPAIEFPTLRTRIHMLGVSLVTRLGDYISDRLEALRRNDEQRKAEEAALTAARKLPILGPALALLDQVLDIVDATDSTADVAPSVAVNIFPHLIGSLCELRQIRDVFSHWGELIPTLLRQRAEKVNGDDNAA
jgi:hypothetical protein